MKINESSRSFFNGLLDIGEQLNLQSSFIVPKTKTDFDTSILVLIGLQKEFLSEKGLQFVDYLEGVEDYHAKDKYIRLKHKINALLTIQDIFPAIVFNDNDDTSMYTIRYFYYESLHLLREFFYCGFNNLQAASNSLLRTIVEFTIRQCYFFKICINGESFNSLNKYFKDGIIPSSQKQMTKIFGNDEFGNPIKKALHECLSNLSQAGSHAYLPKYSPLDEFSINHKYTMSTFYFWLQVDHILTAINWTYFYCFPMLFKPVEVVKKFGFSPPIGICISKLQFKAIACSITEADLLQFVAYAEDKYEVKSILEWINSRNDIDEMTIRKQWKENSKLYTLETGYMQLMAKVRGQSEVLTLKCIEQMKDSVFDIPDNVNLPDVNNLKYWK